MRNLIGERLKKARKAAKLTQLQLLFKLEECNLYLEMTVISKIENGTRPVNDIELVALAKTLKVSVLWLLNMEN